MFKKYRIYCIIKLESKDFYNQRKEESEIMKMSSATKRAMEREYYQSADWFCDFETTEVEGIGYEEGINRRDPSTVIEVDGLYYVWYTRSEGPHFGFQTGDENKKVFPWDYAEVWYAVSKDGYHWEEKGCAVGRGAEGEHDDRSVFTPEILAHEGNYYLVYQTLQHPYVTRSFERIGIAKATSPEGPFIKVEGPILEPSHDGEWSGEADNRFIVGNKGSFDSHKVHDPLLLHYDGKFYLYYKGERMGEELYMGGRETMWGVAIAECAEGPYIKSEYNPITNSGHETCLWKYEQGVAALISLDGVEKNTIQYAEDGINFEIKSVIPNNPPIAPGAFRHNEPIKDPLDGVKWGLCHGWTNGWGCIRRFDRNTNQRDKYRNKQVN